MSESFRREFEELEASGRADEPPLMVFSQRSNADAFATSLERVLGVRGEVVNCQSSRPSYSSVSTRYYAIVVPMGSDTRAEILFSMADAGHKWDGFGNASFETRKGVLREFLQGRAIRRGAWTANIVSQADLGWYGELAALSPIAVKTSVSEARDAFYDQHRREGRAAWKLGASGLVLAGALWYFDVGGIMGAATAGACGLLFLGFAVTRKSRP